MENVQLTRQIANMRRALFYEGLLNDYYVQLERMVTPNNPNFIEELFTTFFIDSANDLDVIEQILQQIVVDYKTLEIWLFKLKGSTSSIGANRVHQEVIKLLTMMKEYEFRGIAHALQDVRRELEILKNHIEPYFEMQRQARAAVRRR